MSALQAKLLEMTKDLSEDTMQLLIGLVQQIVIPMENKAAQSASKEQAAGRIGFMEGVDFMEAGYDIDEYNPEIAKMTTRHKGDVRMFFSDFQLNPQGLLPVIVQDDTTNEVLMLAYMNEDAYRLTVETGKMTYFSRSRQKLWVKGETSGHFQYVKSLTIDCDLDTLLARVNQVGAACHTGNRTCFFQPVYPQHERS